MKDYYEILQVHPKASLDIIKKAYITLAKKYHPDTTELDAATAQQMMKDLNEAYAVLSDASRREAYDQMVRNQTRNQDSSGEEEEYQHHYNWMLTVSNFIVNEIETKIIHEKGHENDNYVICQQLLSYFEKSIQGVKTYAVSHPGKSEELLNFIGTGYMIIAREFTWGYDFIKSLELIKKAGTFLTEQGKENLGYYKEEKEATIKAQQQQEIIDKEGSYDTLRGFKPKNATPNYTASSLTVTEDGDDGNVGIVVKDSNFNIQGNKFGFTTTENTQILTVTFNVAYRVTFNGVNCNLDTSFNISKSAAVAAQGNWQNLEAGDHGSFYYMDKELRLYTADKIGSIEGISSEGAEKIITAVIYRYDDINNNKKCISIDPWLLKANKTYYWWQQNSTFDINGEGGTIYNYPRDEQRERGYNLFFNCSGLKTDTDYENLTPAQKFECMYNMYAFVSALATDTNTLDGGVYQINNEAGKLVTNTSNVADLATKLANKQYSISKTTSDEDMIFMIYDYYRTTYGMGTNGRLLDHNEIAMIYAHRDEFAAALYELDSYNTSKDTWKKLLFDEESMFIISNASQCSEYNDAHDPDTIADRSQTLAMITDAKNNPYTKLFYCADARQYNTNDRKMSITEVFADRAYTDGTLALPSVLQTQFFNGSTKTATAKFKMYCMFTPCI